MSKDILKDLRKEINENLGNMKVADMLTEVDISNIYAMNAYRLCKIVAKYNPKYFHITAHLGFTVGDYHDALFYVNEAIEYENKQESLILRERIEKEIFHKTKKCV